MKIGIWCDYGTTLKPSEGIGVFIANLLGGMSKLKDPPDVVLVVNPSDPKVHRLLLEYAKGLSVQLLGDDGGIIIRVKVAVSRCVKRAGRWLGGMLAVAGQAMRRVPPWKWIVPWLARHKGNPVIAAMRTWTRRLVGLPPLMARAIWGRIAVWFQPYRRTLELARRARCDAWLLPHPGTPVFCDLNAPTVLMLFDMIYRHHPRGFDPDRAKALFDQTVSLAKDVKLCVCASEFIRRRDLTGELSLPAGRTAVLPLAPPQDLRSVVPTDARMLHEKYRLPPRFLFYPSAFRAYKSHGTAVRALQLLRRDHGQDISLVFTGITTPPPYIQAEIAEFGVGGHVLSLGDVPREDLIGLYRQAAALVFPSLDEGFGLPPVEALCVGCPVVCADIPVLREPLGPHWREVIFFKPGDPGDLCRKLLPVLADRNAAVARQASAAAHVMKRTWAEIAGEWMAVLEQAAETSIDQNRSGPATAGAGSLSVQS